MIVPVVSTGSSELLLYLLQVEEKRFDAEVVLLFESFAGVQSWSYCVWTF